MNGAAGVVKDLVYGEEVKAPGLPEYVWVDFGKAYKGPSFFLHAPDEDGRRGWVPVFPKMVSFTQSKRNREKVTYECAMLPLHVHDPFQKVTNS